MTDEALATTLGRTSLFSSFAPPIRPYNRWQTGIMGADAFVVFYGIRYEVPVDGDSEIELLEKRKHPLQIAARNAELDTWWGCLTADADYHLFVGKSLTNSNPEGMALKQPRVERREDIERRATLGRGLEITEAPTGRPYVAWVFRD